MLVEEAEIYSDVETIRRSYDKEIKRSTVSVCKPFWFLISNIFSKTR